MQIYIANAMCLSPALNNRGSLWFMAFPKLPYDTIKFYKARIMLIMQYICNILLH